MSGAEKKTILIIDDALPLARFYSTVLKSEGYEVRVAATCAEALQILSEIPIPDLIFVDCRLGESSGEEVVERIRLERPLVLRQSKIVGFTSFRLNSEPTRKLSSVVSEVIEKPDGIEDFLDIVRRLAA